MPAVIVMIAAGSLYQEPARSLLVAIMFWLKRSGNGQTEVFGLLLRQLRQPDADRFQVQPGDFFVQQLRQAMNAERIILWFRPQSDLRKCLVREAVGHNE